MKSQEKIKKISAQLRTEKKKMRSKRDGAIINLLSRYHDLNKLLKYLENPEYYVVEKISDGGEIEIFRVSEKPTEGTKYTVFLLPEKSDKLNGLKLAP